MKKKNIHIIEVGMKLFAQKGFSATSVQEITKECGISKGAFYLHFKSKDELLLEILQHHFDMITQSITEKIKDISDPREILIQKYVAMFSHMTTHREFFVMLTREQAIPRNETIKQLLIEKQLLFNYHSHRALKQIYGKQITPYIWDISLLLDGIEKAYIGSLLFVRNDFDVRRLSEFMINRLDSLVKGIYQDEPFFTEENSTSIIKSLLSTEQPDISIVMKNLSDAIEKIGSDELMVTYEVLKEELEKSKPRIPVIQGMLSNLNDYPVLEPFRMMIEEYCEK